MDRSLSLKSIGYITITRCLTFYEFGQIYNDICLLLKYHTRYILYIALKILCATPIHSCLPSAHWKQLVFFSSIQFSGSVMSESLRPHESQHARPPCPLPTSESRPSSQWCHPAISSSVVPFSFCPNPSQHQSLFQWVNSSHEVAKVLEFQF